MTYGPPVVKTCEYCKQEYMCPNARKDKWHETSHKVHMPKLQ